MARLKAVSEESALPEIRSVYDRGKARFGKLVEPVSVTAAHPEIGFRTPELLAEHFQKHGRQFGAADEGAYLKLAQALRDRPAGGDVLELKRADGTITRFDRGTGAFLAFDPDLTVRTFFKPVDGEAYFHRQALRDQR